LADNCTFSPTKRAGLQKQSEAGSSEKSCRKRHIWGRTDAIHVFGMRFGRGVCTGNLSWAYSVKKQWLPGQKKGGHKRQDRRKKKKKLPTTKLENEPKGEKHIVLGISEKSLR